MKRSLLLTPYVSPLSADDRPALRTIVRSFAFSVAVTAAVTITILATHLIGPATLLRVFVLAIAAVGSAHLIRLLASKQRSLASDFEARLKREPPLASLRPPTLIRAERDVVLAQSYASYYDAHLRPMLSEALLARLDVFDSAARDMVEAKFGMLWDVIRPDGVLVGNNERGISLSQLQRVVDELEAL